MAKKAPNRAATRKALAQPSNVVAPHELAPGVFDDPEGWDIEALAAVRSEIVHLEAVQGDIVRYLRKRHNVRWLDIAIALHMSVEGARLKYRGAP